MVERSFSGAVWEEQFGYCRALKAGNMISSKQLITIKFHDCGKIFVSGTTSGIDPETGEIIGKGDAYAQSKKILEIVEKSLKELGAELKDVVRTRAFVTDIRLGAEFGKAHKEVFGKFPPVSTMVEIKQLLHKDMLLELEVEAYVADK